MNEITNICRELRKNLTIAEKTFWAEIRNKKLGFKFRRQHPIFYKIEGKSGFFISDFACLEKKLVIELDGDVHDNQKERDIARESIIRYLGYKVIRFGNEQIFQSMGDVINIIKEELGIGK
jgi:leucyl-tRNA synthetase